MNNLFNTCYLCLTPSSNLIPLYHGNGKDCNKIKYILPELVFFEPEVPQSICCSCLVTTNSFYLFKKKCLENNQRLMYIVNKRHQQEQQQQQQHRLQQQQQQQQQQQHRLQQQQQYLIQQQQQHPQLEHQQHQQQIINAQTFQFPQQPRQLETTRPRLNCSIGTTLLSNNDARLQRNLVDVININEDDNASFNYTKLTAKQISEQFVNNEFNSNNPQIQDTFSLSVGHKQTNSVVNSKDVLENIGQFYASNIRSNHESQVINQSKTIETKTEKNCKNAEPTKNNFFEHNIYVRENPLSIYNDTNRNENNIQLTGNQKDDEDQRTSKVVENISSFCDRQLPKNLNIIETRPTENHFDNRLKCTNIETKNSDLISKQKHGQKLSLVDNIERKQEAVYQNKLKCPEPQTLDSLLLSAEEQSKKSDVSLTENVNSFCKNSTTEQNYIEPRNTIIDNIEIKENFDVFSGQQLTNKEKYIETRRLEEIFENELKCFKTKIKPLVSQSAVEHSPMNAKEDVNNRKENFTSFRIDSMGLEARKQEAVNDNYLSCFKLEINEDSVSLPTANCKSQQLLNEQKDLETNNTEVENEHLPSVKTEFEDYISRTAEASSNDVNTDVKGNFASLHTQQLPNKQKDLETRNTEAEKEHLPSLKIKIEDSVSIPAKRNVNTQEHSNNQKDLETKSTKAEKQYLSSVDSNNDVKGNFSSLHTQQLSNGQKDLETRNKEAKNEHLPSCITESEDSVSLAAVEESSVEDEQSNQETVFQNHLSCAKVEIEDSDSLFEEEDTEIYSFTDDFEVKEEFVPHYSSDSKFYRELINSINSESDSNNSKLSFFCPKVNTLISNFYNNFHNKSVKNSNIVRCPICANKLDLASMPNHLKTHVSNNDFDKCKCTICSEELLKGMLPRHLDLHHKKTAKKVNCPVCDKVVVKKNLRPHLKTHERCLTNFQCNICNKKYKIENYFEQHKKTHTLDTEGRQYKCEFCEKEFYFKAGLKSHMLHHTCDKKFECRICKAKFFTEYNLTSHQSTHTAKTWKCSDCDKLFNHASNLYQHRKIHIGIKKYECKICNMKFLHDSHLKQHEHTHTGAKRKKFKCTVCKKAFIYNGTLKKHMKTHANDDSDTE